MLNQNGGIIGPANIPTTTSAKGKWSLAEYYLAKSQNIWPSVTPNEDPYFEYTTLLLPGNGTNGAQNNTFLDGSTNNFTITRNGNTTQGTFSPFSQTGWGNYFDGTGDYLTVPDNAAFAFGSGAVTIETWAYFNTTISSFVTLLAQSDNASAAGSSFIFVVDSTGKVNFEFYYGSLTLTLVDPNTVPINQWVHLAVARNTSNTISLYVNGNRKATNASFSASVNDSSQAVSLGGRTSGVQLLNGYLSNSRIVKGTAVYDPTQTTLTVPTSPLTAITNTSLLTCQSNRFIDNSSNNFTITRNGDTRVVAFSPFNPTASWSAETYGGSGYFDGSGDYLSVADNANLRLGTSAFTIQAWVYRNASGTAHSIIAKGGASTGYVLQVTSTNVLRFTHGTTNVDTTTTIPASAWTHVAAVRTNTSTNGFQLYINGVSSATATVSTDFNQTDTLYIGADRGAANVMNGYISGLKYTNGTAESISVPTEPPTSTTNVVLLLNFTNAGIYDATSKNDLETVGNAQISTTQSKWGGSSISFDGTGDWLLIPDQPPQRIGTGKFTIELWVYRNSSGTYGLVGKGTGTTGWLVSLNSSNQVVFTYASSTITSTGTVSATTWTHIAVVREGTSTNQTKIYINGTNDGTGTVSTDFNQTNSMYIGADRTGGSAANAYVQDVRITNDARYTANFTAPTAAFLTL
jgi:hypothetical protein